MTTLTLKINERNKTGKAFLELVDFFNSKDKKVVEVVQEKSPYNPEFVKKIKESEQALKLIKKLNLHFAQNHFKKLSELISLR